MNRDPFAKRSFVGRLCDTCAFILILGTVANVLYFAKPPDVQIGGAVTEKYIERRYGKLLENRIESYAAQASDGIQRKLAENELGRNENSTDHLCTIMLDERTAELYTTIVPNEVTVECSGWDPISNQTLLDFSLKFMENLSTKTKFNAVDIIMYQSMDASEFFRLQDQLQNAINGTENVFLGVGNSIDEALQMKLVMRQ